VKVATAAEPVCGEGERGEFYEVLAQVDDGAILELGEAAGLARHEEDFEAARVAGVLVVAKGAPEVGVSLERGREDDGVFDGEAGALTEIWADGMSGIAEDGDATNYPGKRCQAILNFCADCAFGIFDEFGDGSVPAGEKCAQGNGFGHIRRSQGVVCNGVPVDAAGAETQDAEAPAMAIGFGKVAVVFEAEMASLVVGVDVGHAAPDAVGAIGEFAFEAEGFAHGGMNAIAGDDEIGFGRGSIFKVKRDGVGTLFEAQEGMVQVDGVGRHGLRQRGLQFGAMDGDAVAIGGRERKSLDAFAIGIFHEQAAERAAASLEPKKNARVDLVEGPDGIGPEAHARTDFFQFRRAFVDVHLESDFA